MNPIQIRILNTLLFKEKARFGELKPFEVEGSHFVFHLEELIKKDLLEKSSSKEYTLTSRGIEFANRMDTSQVIFRQQPKTTTVFCAYKDNINVEKEFLLYNRLKNPFYNHQGFPTTKVWFGEKIEDAAARGLKEEANLKGVPVLIGIRRYRVFKKSTDEILEDKIMYIFRIKNPIGKLESKKDGHFQWIKQSEIADYVTKPLNEFEEVLQLLLSNNENKIDFKELNYYAHTF